MGRESWLVDQSGSLMLCRDARCRTSRRMHRTPIVLAALVAFPLHAAERGIVNSAFIYDTGPYPSVHASTIVETREGELLAAWFGGTNEKNPDVCIYLSRYERGQWLVGAEVANGVHEDKRYPTWNPVLFQPADGPLMLFYKVGPSPQTWWGMLKTSTDGGRTWSQPKRLPDGFLGPIKNKPIQLSDGTLLAPSSVEDDRGWRVHVEITRDLGHSWERSAPPEDNAFNAIQPSILHHRDGRLQLLSRTKEMLLVTNWSSDSGKTWSRTEPTGLFMPNSGSDAVTLSDGRQLLVYNYRDCPAPATNARPVREDEAGPSPLGTRADYGVRYPLNVSVSPDGMRWTMVLTLEDQPMPHGYAYPAVIQTRDGLVHITYTWNRQKIKHVVVDPRRL